MRQIALALMLFLPACVSSSYMGIPLTAGNADPTIWDLAIRAREGDRQAQLDLGIRFEEGRGIAPDVARAIQLYRLAASDSGEPIWVYSPSVRNGERGRVSRIETGPRVVGLKEARSRLKALKMRLGK